MFVGVARIALHLPGARSLKDKRQVVRSFKDRLQARLRLNVAEVGDSERLQVATIGVCCVSSEAEVCYELLQKARGLANALPEAMLSDFRTRVVSFGADGKALLDQAPFGIEDEDE